MRTRLTPPPGTRGMMCAPWSPGEIYAVAAVWERAEAPVYRYTGDGWEATGRQVADHGHRASKALEAELRLAIAAGCADDVDDPVELVNHFGEGCGPGEDHGFDWWEVIA